MYAETIAEMRKMLINLDGWMSKAEKHAETKKFDVNNYTTMRLAADMFPFTKQVQSCCDVAKFAAAYLSEKTAPVHEDTETTWTELRERVKKCVNYLEGFKSGDFAKVATIKVSPKWAEGKSIVGTEYLTELSVPNFYFHITTCYALLRHAGVDIGKMDYIGSINLK